MTLMRKRTAEFCEYLDTEIKYPDDSFQRARQVAQYLGAQVIGTDTARFGFWAPELLEEGIPEERVALQLLSPLDDTPDLTAPEQRSTLSIENVEMIRWGEYCWAIVSGVTPGARERLGTLYRLRFLDNSGNVRYIYDPLASSVPFGAAAPAELYDMENLFAQRRDSEHFSSLPTIPDPDGVPRVTAPISLLEVHTPTATTAGTIAGLTREYRRIAEAVLSDAEITPADEALLGYEAIQLMPIEPTILFETGETFWHEETGDRDDTVTVTLRRPYSTNWGYDVITLASPAVNPVLLETGRPDELLELIEVLHTFPDGPIKIVFDVVYGHADNQALTLLHKNFFAGANMYGQNLNYRHPVVRSILLEMQRRKGNFGVDGIRVDGAQDFVYWVEEADRLFHDDEYLAEMNALEHEVAGVRYRPWMIFEDGRPWPRDDWELSSTYHEVTKKLPRVVQWGPLTFAHNTPFLFTFWIGKWWRIRELFETGAHWITGNSNHDTLRRGTQVPINSLINSYLGSNLPEVFENGYDNPGSRLFDVVTPGIPMDFLNANLRGPWSFVRNIDAKWAIKVVSEETWFLDWNVTPQRFNQSWAFPRLKGLGFRSLDGMRRFIRSLDAAVRNNEYDREAIANHLNAVRPRLEGPPEFDGPFLQSVARAWMDDIHEFCNLDRYRDRTNSDPYLAAVRRYATQLRRFRSAERWLAGNLTGPDAFDYLHPTKGTVLLYGYRKRPEIVASSDGMLPIEDFAPASEWREVAFFGNMEGAPREFIPRALLTALSVDPRGEWQEIVATPSLRRSGRAGASQSRRLPGLDLDSPIQLSNSQGILIGRTSL